MKLWVIFFSFLCISSFLIGSDPEDNGDYKFFVQEKQYSLQTVFEFDSEGRPFGTVIIYKYVNPLGSRYHFYDENGLWQSTGKSVLLCLGAGGWGKVWGTEIEVFDNTATFLSYGNRIGYIDGQIATTGPAKFSFYNEKNEKVGVAYLDETKSGFTIVDPLNDQLIIARLTRQFIQDTIDPWEVHVYKKSSISPILIKLFAAFAVDSQEYFKADH